MACDPVGSPPCEAVVLCWPLLCGGPWAKGHTTQLCVCTSSPLGLSEALLSSGHSATFSRLTDAARWEGARGQSHLPELPPLPGRAFLRTGDKFRGFCLAFQVSSVGDSVHPLCRFLQYGCREIYSTSIFLFIIMVLLKA